MLNKFICTVLSLLIVGCPFICGQCGVACAQAEANADTQAAGCQLACCANHASSSQGSDSSPARSPGDCPCESMGTCICDGAVVDNAKLDDRQPTAEHLFDVIMVRAMGDLPIAAGNLAFAADSPPGYIISGRDVRTRCASFLL